MKRRRYRIKCEELVEHLGHLPDDRARIQLVDALLVVAFRGMKLTGSDDRLMAELTRLHSRFDQLEANMRNGPAIQSQPLAGSPGHTRRNPDPQEDDLVANLIGGSNAFAKAK